MITSEKIKAARRLLGWSLATLSRKSGRSYSTMVKAEAGTLNARSSDGTLDVIRRTFETAGVAFAETGVSLATAQDRPTQRTATGREQPRRSGRLIAGAAVPAHSDH